MFQSIMSLCMFLCLSSLFLVSGAQFFDDAGAASLGSAPVGFISRVGRFGDQESYASLGNAPVGVYQRRQYPQPWYQVARIPVVEVHRPVKPPVHLPCRLPGPCDQIVKPVMPVRPPPARPYYKPVVQPPVKPVVQPPRRPVVRPPVKPVVHPPMRPVVRPPKSYVTRMPKTYRPSTKPKGVGGRNSGGLLGGLLGGSGLLGGLLGGR